MESVSKIYREYVTICEFRKVAPVSDSKFREIFNGEFNLSFKSRHSDTCKTCDEIDVALKNILITNDRKEELSEIKESHFNLVEKVRKEFNDDVSEAKQSDGKTIVLTFDLQKTLETPSLTTSVAFYKRQLWTFNLCISDEVTQVGHMYIWDESVASRGSQEIGSCLLKHFKTKIPDTVEKIILYSDSCGGQNRNIKLTLLLKHFLASNEKIKSIQQKFLVSGHSFNSCDRNFSTIEKKKKITENVYVPEQWIQLIQDAKRALPVFDVNVMATNDFVSSEMLEKQITNRKKDIAGEKINWLKIRSILHLKQKPMIIYIKDDNDKAQIIDFKKRNISQDNLAQIELNQLYPHGKTITTEKLNDLMDLLKYVPPEFHSFYKNLKSNPEDIDYGLASDSEDE